MRRIIGLSFLAVSAFLFTGCGGDAAGSGSKMGGKMDSKMEGKMGSSTEGKMDSKMEGKMESKMEGKTGEKMGSS